MQSPVFDASAQRIASLVLSTANDTSSNSSFVLNASSNIRTQVYLVPIKADAKAQPGSAAPGTEGDLIKVNLKVPVFVADTATVEPYCATFDPSPEAPSPMTVEPCEDVSNDMPASEGTPEIASASASAPANSTNDKSQVFLFDPETGVIKPDWGSSTASAKSVVEHKDDKDPRTSSVAPPTSTSASSSSTASASSTSAAFAAKAAETSSLSSLPAPSAPTAPATPSSPASSTPVESYPSETSSIPELPKMSSAVPNVMAAPSSYVHTASAPASMLPHPSAAASSIAGAVPSAPVPMPVQPSVSAAASHPASSVAGSAPTPSVSVPAVSTHVVAAAAASSSAPAVSPAASSSAPAAALPSASAPATPVNQGNNVTLIFSPSQASVLSKDKDETASALNLSPAADREDALAAASSDQADDMDDVTGEDGEVEAASFDNDNESEDDEENDLNSEAGSGLVARSHKQKDDCDDTDGYSVKSASTKTKAKAKLPEGQENRDQGETKKISLGKGGVAVEDATKLKEESAADKAAKGDKVKAKGQKASSSQSKLNARFLRRQQTVSA